jgi:hypothetical protein
MEWGLRKVVPKLSQEKKNAFASHIIPVILELCTAGMTEEGREEFLRNMCGTE